MVRMSGVLGEELYRLLGGSEPTCGTIVRELYPESGTKVRQLVSGIDELMMGLEVTVSTVEVLLLVTIRRPRLGLIITMPSELPQASRWSGTLCIGELAPQGRDTAVRGTPALDSNSLLR